MSIAATFSLLKAMSTYIVLYKTFTSPLKMQVRYRLVYVVHVITSMFMVSALDAFKLLYAEQRVTIGIDVVILAWIPLSTFVTVRVLRRCIEDIQAPVLPFWRTGHDSCRASEGLNDLITTFGFGHTFAIDPIAPILFILCRSSMTTILTLSLFAVLIFGLCLELSGIRQNRWGYFLYFYLLVTIPLQRVVTISRWVVALLEGRIRILERDEEELIPFPGLVKGDACASANEQVLSQGRVLSPCRMIFSETCVLY
ncbi:uncharacterized protein C8R40DRAFT_571459 [Lentinula edodes]|uniref:uncharacterized protein n=1 Tax=Lentinula edodes TaxID=5353 RepID=UPI001E8E7830|nr:uncharacterized protein C8R40DRAFT_571459 [Lentinula edodes]KAH7871180.1 hypothetical protein C8R40DRAFT_571459 [Lentinula edodes]